MAVNLLIGQTSEHQRLGVERKTEWEVSLEAGTSGHHESWSMFDVFLAEAYLATDVLLGRTWSFGFQLPVSARFVYGQESQRFTTAGMGDVLLRLGWQGRLLDMRAQVSASLRMPTGLWQPEAEAEGWLAAGSGWWQPGLQGTVSWIFDPVVLGLSLAYSTGLPRQERYGMVWQPGIIDIGLSCTEVLNTSIGYSLSINHQLVSPLVYGINWNPDDFSYALNFSGELWYARDKQALRLSLSKTLTNLEAPYVVGLSWSHTFKSGEEDA